MTSAIVTDVLDHVPWNDLSTSLWDKLCPLDRRRLMACGRHARDLACSLITSAEFRDHSRDRCHHDTLRMFRLFLTRRPMLSALLVACDPHAHDYGEEEVDVLSSWGGASEPAPAPCRHLTRMLVTASVVGTSLIDGIRRLCPTLRALHIGGALSRFDDDAMGVGGCRMGPAAIDRIGCLIGLGSLRLADVFAEVVIPTKGAWIGLRDTLTSCVILANDRQELGKLTDVAPILELGRLTRLVLLSVTASEAATTDRTAALASLANLVNLRDLQLGDAFDADAETFAAVRCLTRLTSLGMGRSVGMMDSSDTGTNVGGDGMTWVTSVALPNLCRLGVAPRVSPSQLLGTFRGLGLLPALTHIVGSGEWDASGNDGREQDDISFGSFTITAYGSSEVAVRHEADMFARLALLWSQQSPGLLYNHVSLDFGGPYPMTLSQLADALRPSRGFITRMQWIEWADDIDDNWEDFATAVPRLQSLCLMRSDLSGPVLMQLTEHLVTLRRLSLFHCYMDGQCECDTIGCCDGMHCVDDTLYCECCDGAVDRSLTMLFWASRSYRNVLSNTGPLRLHVTPAPIMSTVGESWKRHVADVVTMIDVQDDSSDDE